MLGRPGRIPAMRFRMSPAGGRRIRPGLGIVHNHNGMHGTLQGLAALRFSEPLQASSTFGYFGPMCRNIKTLFNFDPPVTDEEVRAASLQFVRKVTGFNKPSKANEAAFHAAVDEIARISGDLLRGLETSAPPRDREEQAARAKARAARRFA